MTRAIVAAALVLASLSAPGCAGNDRVRTASLHAGSRTGAVARQQLATGELRDVLLSLRRVHFALDSSTLPMASRQALLEAATVLAVRSDIALGIDGHADHRGASEYNLGLGQRRAAIVASVLAGAGVDHDRLGVTSFGEERPLVDGADELSLARNRRVEFHLMRGNVQLVLDEGDLIDDHGAVLSAMR